MQIGHFTTSFPRFSNDEAGVFIKRLIEAMAAEGQRGHVFVPWDYKESQYDECAGFKVRRFRYSLITKGYLAFRAGIMPNIKANPIVLAQAPIMLFQFFRHGLKVIKELDILHAHWVATAIPVTILGKLKNRPVVVTLHGDDIRLLQKSWLRPLLLPALKMAAAIVCVNRSPQSELVRSFPFLLNKIHCIPYGVNTPQVNPEQVEHFKRTKLSFGKRLSALFVGSVVERKGIDILIHAIQDAPNWNLIICGRIQDKSYFNKLRKTIQEYQCQDRIFFEGAVEPAQIPLYMSSANIYVSASRHEGRPNAVLEAMAAGLPTILSDIPAHREVVESDKNGLLFALDDANNLAKAIVKLENNQELLNQFALASKNLVADMSWANCARQYIKLFRAVINE